MAVCVAGFALVACTAVFTSPSEPTPESIAPTIGTAECASVELRRPDGTRLDLTGTWHGAFGVHYIRQDGSCVWWVGLDGNQAETLGARQLVAFRGEIAPDFTVTGEWTWINRPSLWGGRLHGPVTFEIQFGSEGGTETITLQSTIATAGPPELGLGPYQGAVTLVYEGRLPSVLP